MHQSQPHVITANHLLMSALISLQLAHAGAPTPTTLATEDLNSDGEGSRYTSSSFDDGGQDFFERQTSNPDPRHLGSFTFSSPQGGSYWTSEDVEDGLNPLVDHGIVRLNNVSVSGFNNLQVSVFLATADTLRFDIEDIIEIQAAVDGNLPGDPTNLTQGTYTTIGRFIGNGPDIFASEAMKLDSDLDGVVFGDGDDAGSPTLSSTMQEFIFNVPFTGNDLSVQIRIEQNGGSEEIAFDHIRVQGLPTVTDPPVLANIEGPAIMFTEGDPATQITNTITVTDPDSTDLQGATVVITAGLDPTEDVLAASPPTGITANPYDSATGTLTFTGTASLADYQTALRSVTYENTDTVNPSTAIRTIRFQVNDGGNSSNFQTRNVQVESFMASSTIPHLEDFDTDGEGDRYTSSTYNQGGMDFFERSSNPHPGHAAAFGVTSPQGGALWAFEDVNSAGNPLGNHGIVRLQNLDATGLSNLQVSLFLGELAALGEFNDKIEIQYAFDGDIPANPTDLSSGNYTTFGRFVADSPDAFTTGAMKLDSDLDGTTHLDPEDAGSPTLSSTMTESTFAIPATGNLLSIQIRVEQDGGSEELAFDHIEVTGSAVAGTPPVLAAIEPGAILYTEGDPATLVSNTITVADPDPTLIASATVQITGGFDAAQDVLADNGSVPASISVAPFNPGTGTLTLTGPASPAEFQAALQAITYQNTNPVNPSTAVRTITFQAIDGDGNPSNLQSRDVLVTPLIDSAPAPLVEDFETDGDGERYTASDFNTGALQSFFERVTTNPDPRHGAGGFTGFTFTAPQAGAYWAAEDVEDPANPLVDHGIIRLRDVEMTGWTDREVRLYLAQSDNRFDLNDKIEIQYATDGNSGGSNLASGNYTTIGRFIGAGADIFSDGPMQQDVDLNGNLANDGGSPALSTTMTEFAFDIPDGGDLVSVQIRVAQNGGSEELAIDHIEITGTQPVETVANAGDNGPGSLRQTIADSVPGTTILFDPSLDGETITLTSGQLLVDKDLTIDASGLSCNLVIDAGGASRLLAVSGAGTELQLNNLHFRGGAAGRGGAIDNTGGSLVRAEDCSFTGNKATSFGGGAIYNTQSSTVELLRCTFSGNSAAFLGGAISSWNSATLSATNCTFTNNFAQSEGGAVHNVNGSNSTLVHCTITANETGGSGGGIFRGSGTITLENSIVAGNRADIEPDILGPFNALGANLTSGDPMLSPLSEFGGCTRTLHPLAGSPALDAAVVSGATPATDQRELPRSVGASPDIGAVEGGPVITVVNTANSGAGSLRQAINDASANPGTRIYFDPAVFPATVEVISQVTIGSGRNVFIDASDIPGGVAVTSSGLQRIFICQSNPVIGMHSLKIFGGDSSIHANKGGGAIRNIAGSKLTLVNSGVSGNNCPVDGGAIYNNGGSTELHLFNSTVAGNTAFTGGGGIQSNGGARLEITNSTISGNTSETGVGGGINVAGSNPVALITNSTISGNTAASHAGGLYINSGTATARLTNGTIVNNASGLEGGGIYNIGNLTIQNTIVAGNSALTNGIDFRTTGSSDVVTSLGGNLIGDNQGNNGAFSTGTPNASLDYVGDHSNPLDPLLGDLRNNGGPTATHTPLTGSLAIDNGQAPGIVLITDQRGSGRVRDGNDDATATIDIGAVEPAPTIIVDTAVDEDDGPGVGNGTSLRDAIAAATDPDGTRILFDPNVFNGEPTDQITLTLGELLVSGQKIEIDGASGGASGVTISGNNTVRVLRVTGSSEVTLRHLTIADGNTTGSGGGIIVDGANQTSSLLVDSCLVRNNSANSAGGGIMNASQTVDLVNSTFTGNSAGAFGGGFVNNAPPASASVVHCTFTGNSAPGTAPGGISNNGGTMFMQNTIVAESTGRDIGIANILISGGGNFVGDNLAVTGQFPEGSPNANGDYVGSAAGGGAIVPQLSSLAKHGGPTQTRRPLAGSPVIDTAASCPASTDQRGAPRASGTAPDIGAVEAQQTMLVDLATDGSDDPFSGGLTLREAIDFADPVGPVITFSPRLDGGRIVLGGTQLTADSGRSFTIDASALPRGLVIDADKKSRVFAFDSAGTIELRNLTITGGVATSAGSANDSGGGIRTGNTNLTVVGCTIHGNLSRRGAGLFSFTSPDLITTATRLVHCTVSNNQATVSGGGIRNNEGLTEIVQCTITANTAPSSAAGNLSGGGGVASFGGAFTQTSVAGSIIAGNANDDVDLIGSFVNNTFVSIGYNLIGTGNAVGNFGPATFDDTGITDPKLSPLACYGGPTPVHHPLAGSPAIDTGQPAPAEPVDQRGFPSLVDGGVGLIGDRGAVEAGPLLLVTSDLDSGAGTLRDRIAAVTAPGTRLLFDTAATFSAGGTITFSSEIVVSNRTLLIDASNVGGNGIILDGGNTTRLMQVNGTATVGLQNLTLQNANTASSSGTSGGAIRNYGILTVADSTFLNNTSDTQGGAIDNQERLCVVDCHFEGNFASGSTTASSGDGGAIINRGTGSVGEVRGSTFFNNTATSDAGAIFNAAALVHPILRVSNSTFHQNSATSWSGAIQNNGGSTYGILELHHCTITDNSIDGQGGGIRNAGQLTIQNTIVAGNTTNNFGPDILSDGSFASVTTLGGNIIGDNTNESDGFPAGAPNANGDYVGSASSPVDPLLGPLADHGGPTLTRPPLAFSPAIDFGTSPSCPHTDQRGYSRPSGNAPDSGAVELVAIIVNTAFDESDGATTGDISLRDAINYITSPPIELITFDPNVFPATITLDSVNGQITIPNRSLFIDASTIAQPGVTVDGGGATRLFNISGTSDVGMDSLTLTGGNGSGADGGAFIVGGATLRLNRSTLTGNTAPGGLGGGILMFGTAQTHLSNSLVSNNSAPGLGGGLMSFSGDFFLTNTTFTDNQSGPGSAVYMQGTGHLSLNHVTVSGNTGGNALQNGASSTTIENSIVAGNIGGDLLNPGGTTLQGNNMIGGSPLLAPLSNYGGPTLSMPPLPDSPAVDDAVTLATTPTSDQRGFARNQGAASDIGAVERSALFAEAGPQLIASENRFLTDSVHRDDTAGDTLFFRYTVDPISDFTTENYFAGFQLYENGAERLGVGNPFFRAAYGAYNTSVGDIDLNSANPEPNLPYELVRSGVPRTLVFRVDFVPGGVDNVSVWLAPDLGLPDFAQPATLLTTFTANCTFNEVQIREGFSANGWNYSDMEISELSPFATPVTFAGLHPGLDPNGDENGDGLSNYYHYAAGDDPANPVFFPTLIGGLYTHTARLNGSDVFLDYEYSFGLQSFLPMVEGVHYNIDSTSFAAPGVQTITLDILFDPMVNPDVFWRHRFVTAIP